MHGSVWSVLILLAVASVAGAQERLEWGAAPGARYTVRWESTGEDRETTETWVVDGNMRRLEASTERLDRQDVQAMIELVAEVHSGVATLRGRITDLAVAQQGAALRLVATSRSGGPLQAQIVSVPGTNWGPVEEARVRDAFESLRVGLAEDLALGLRLVQDPDGSARVERLGATGSSLWRTCFVQPALPLPLDRGVAWVVPARDQPSIPGLAPPPGVAPTSPARWTVLRFRADRVELGFDWRAAWDTSDVQGTPGFRIIDRDVLDARASSRVDFDRRDRHVTTATRSSAIERTTTSTVNNHLMRRQVRRTAGSSEVTVRALAP